MKSVIQEGSSVAKAVAKAWESAGKPEEFSIKIYETEKTNFFGLLRRAAVVSIFYNQKRPYKGNRERSNGYRNNTRRNGRESYNVSSRESFKSTPYVEESASSRTSSYNEDAPRRDSRSTGQRSDRREAWHPELIDEISGWLTETTEKMGVTTSFDTKVDGGVLKVTFETPVLEQEDYERMLFASFSHLLMQFLKRAHKNKFRSLRLLIQSRR